MTQLTIETLPIRLQNYHVALQKVLDRHIDTEENCDPVFVLKFRMALNEKLIRLLALLKDDPYDTTALSQLLENLNQYLKDQSEDSINAFVDKLNTILLDNKDSLFILYYSHKKNKAFFQYAQLGEALMLFGVFLGVLVEPIGLLTVFIGAVLSIYGIIRDYQETTYHDHCKNIATAIGEALSISSEPFSVVLPNKNSNRVQPNPFKFFGFSDGANQDVAEEIQQSYLSLVTK